MLPVAQMWLPIIFGDLVFIKKLFLKGLSAHLLSNSMQFKSEVVHQDTGEVFWNCKWYNIAVKKQKCNTLAAAHKTYPKRHSEW